MDALNDLCHQPVSPTQDPGTSEAPPPPQAQAFRIRDLALREETMRELLEQTLPVGLGRLEKLVTRQGGDFLTGDTAGGGGGR